MEINRAAASQNFKAITFEPSLQWKTFRGKMRAFYLLLALGLVILLLGGMNVCVSMPSLVERVTDEKVHPILAHESRMSPSLGNDLPPLDSIALSENAAQAVSPKPVYMANYVSVEDFPILASYGINTLLVDLEADGSDWEVTYDAAIQTNLRLIPLIWGNDQSIWAWNIAAQEWELNQSRYPYSTGAQFLGFLRHRPDYLAQTFAIYGFHEPLNSELGFVSCQQMAKFYQQITQEEFPEKNLFVYSEDLVLGWPDSENCRSGIQDYEVHTLYPFCNSPRGKYRPFDVQQNWHYDPTDDLDFTLQAELAHLDERLRVLAEAAAAPNTGRKPKVIVLIQTFAAQVDDPELWNRMPSAAEMRWFAEFFMSHRGDQIAGLAWYPFELVADNYTQALQTNRYDLTGADRWAVLGEIGQRFFSQDQRRLYLPIIHR